MHCFMATGSCDLFLCKRGHGCRGAVLSVLAARSRGTRDPPVADVNLLEPLHFEGRAQADVDLPDRIGAALTKFFLVIGTVSRAPAGICGDSFRLVASLRSDPVTDQPAPAAVGVARAQ